MENKAVKIIVLAVIAVAVAAVILFVVFNGDNGGVTEPGSTVSSSTSEQTTESTDVSTSEQTTESTTETETKPTTQAPKTTTEPASNGKFIDIDTLINYENPLPDDWEIDLVDLINGHRVDSRVYDSLQKMLEDCKAQGYNPLICSSFRTHEKQTTLFNNKVQQYLDKGYSEEQAKIEAAKWVAVPGTSEHQTGLALDIVSVENQNLDNSQLKSPCQQWLMEHCYDYGFILRYPEDKTDITKIDFEPWHYRYVGVEAAKEIQEKGICLEEYAELHK